MLSALNSGNKLIGIKQSKLALRAGEVIQCYVAMDADPNLVLPIIDLCGEVHCPVVKVEKMSDLGKACGIDVGASVAVVLK